MSEFPTTIEYLDKIFITITGASLAIPAIATAYDLDTKLVWIPIIFYFILMIYEAFRYSLIFKYPELAIIERMKTWAYLFSLGVTLIGNFFLINILPKTFNFFIAGIIIVPLLLALIVKYLPSRLFRREIIYMNANQEKDVSKILIETGSASIFFSISVLLVNISSQKLIESSIGILIINFGISLLLFVTGYIRERRSSNLTKELAISLINSGWYKKYSQRFKVHKN